MNCRPGRISPPQLRRGGCAIKKMQRSNRNSRRRGGVNQVRLNSLDQHHPGRSNNVASQLFLCVAATPPQLRRGYPADLQFIHTFIDLPDIRERIPLKTQKGEAVHAAPVHWTLDYLPYVASRSSRRSSSSAISSASRSTTTSSTAATSVSSGINA